MSFGLTPEGFSRKRLDDIKTEIENDLKNRFGNYINLLPQSVFGQIVGLFSDREAELWEMAEDVYNSQYPDTAEGVSLDNVVALTGITRLGATKSRIMDVALFGDAGTVVPAGTQFSVAGNPNAKFLTDLEVTLGIGVNEIQLLSFATLPMSGSFKLSYRNEVTDLIAFDALATEIQNKLNALEGLEGVIVTGDFNLGFSIEFAGVDGKQDQPLLVVVDNTTGALTTITTTQQGAAQALVDVTAVDFGPTQAIFGTLTVIDTPVSGLDSVKNLDDAVVGRNVETDFELRQRRGLTLQVAGAATPDAIRARLLNLVGVTDVIIFENITSLPDMDGRPEKSFEAVVAGGDEQEIFDSIYQAKPAGIETFGSEIGSSVDSQGVTHEVRFSRPTNVPIYVSVSLVTDPLRFPANGNDTVRDAIVAFINELGIGSDVIVVPQLICSFAGVQGILDAEIFVGIAPSPTLSDNIIIDANEIPVTDNLKVIVT